jgi:hypothetical protein
MKLVIPAKAGIKFFATEKSGIPAFVGMTRQEQDNLKGLTL